MHETILNKYAINQAGYYVKDLEEAARAHSALFGSGPFMYMDPVTPAKVSLRGKEAELTMQTAYGQLGAMQIELIQVLSEGPHVYEELGHYGFHHFSMWVDDLDGAVQDFAGAGFEPAMVMESGGGLQVVYIDCLKVWGHYVEIHAPIENFWNMVADASKDWDGSDPYRKFGT